MATERQIAANRANAKRSTGPKSEVGRSNSSRNAYRHGLSCPVPTDAVAAEKLRTIAAAVAGEESSSEQQQAATEFARAQLELMRVEVVQRNLLREINSGNVAALQRLVALDRYDRAARTVRRRASGKLWKSS